MDGCDRPYYEDLGRRPLLVYVVFGVGDDQLQISRERHHVDEFPEGLELTLLQSATDGFYMDSLIGGTLGTILREKDPALYDTAQRAEKWAVLQGEAQQDTDLHYLRNAIGIVEALLENGAIGVLDLQTFSLFSPEAWRKEIFEPEFSPYAHVAILQSENEDGTLWIHTRGMRKFGRPDISLEQVPTSEVERAVLVVEQMLYYGAVGAFFTKPVRLHTRDGLTYQVTPQFFGDWEHPDFNNAYYQLYWEDCVVLE